MTSVCTVDPWAGVRTVNRGLSLHFPGTDTVFTRNYKKKHRTQSIADKFTLFKMQLVYGNMFDSNIIVILK